MILFYVKSNYSPFSIQIFQFCFIIIFYFFCFPQTLPGKQYAIKVIDKQHLSTNKQDKDALRTEIAVLKLVRHPNIIQCIGYCLSPKKNCIITELISGGDLMLYLKDPCKSLDDMRKLKATCAVKYLHSNNIVHRDIKSNNYLVTDNSVYSCIYISRFLKDFC